MCNQKHLRHIQESFNFQAISINETNSAGITHLKIVGSKILSVRLCGTLELYQLQSRNQGCVVDWNFSCAYRRTHVRTGSVGSIIKDKSNQVSYFSLGICRTYKLHYI